MYSFSVSKKYQTERVKFGLTHSHKNIKLRNFSLVCKPLKYTRPNHALNLNTEMEILNCFVHRS